MVAFLGAVGLTSVQCGYMRLVVVRWNAESAYREKPSQTYMRTIAPEKCVVVYGVVEGDVDTALPMAVVALSSTCGDEEIVDVYRLIGPGYFSLYLPAGRYRLVVAADLDGDSSFAPVECIGAYNGGEPFSLQPPDTGRAVAGGLDIKIVSPVPAAGAMLPTELRFPPSSSGRSSEYYPSGALRSLDDEIFAPKYGLLGLYDPSAFLATAGIYFYAIRERDIRRTPVVFVHGAGGTPREFRYLVEHLDSTRYDAWFFYYPSGESLSKLAEVFHEIFLSGRIIRMRGRPLIVVAHSMGGLVVREAINRSVEEGKHGRSFRLFISLCTPYGGSVEAAAGLEQAPIVLPSWRDIAEGSAFLASLHRHELPRHLDHFLFFAYRNRGSFRMGENSDETATLRSQLTASAQRGAVGVYGFNETHTSILKSRDVSERINAVLNNYR